MLLDPSTLCLYFIMISCIRKRICLSSAYVLVYYTSLFMFWAL
ncbi:hypothetical protein EUBDOL_00932 [Amedibacillus dolichus DSM 3991]|uniref:Uncharacterized protein n=1 Tax=Amedibacillus dolichus DSM 3991 TaxID=428127 RepID=A8RAW3_9FIRM|nr:hypothetical protein EUBDOL_00932 [Amedibacillus dolichus DSM 3991]